MGHPEDFPPPDELKQQIAKLTAAPVGVRYFRLAAEARLCSVCGHVLILGERKYHRGRCARVRASQLQKLSRERRRR
jgi:hypothetical protein